MRSCIQMLTLQHMQVFTFWQLLYTEVEHQTHSQGLWAVVAEVARLGGEAAQKGWLARVDEEEHFQLSLGH